MEWRETLDVCWLLTGTVPDQGDGAAPTRAGLITRFSFHWRPADR